MHNKLAYLLLRYNDPRGKIVILNKKKLFTALFCALLMTGSAFGSALDQEVIQVLRRVLQKMAPGEIAQIEREGVAGWQRVTINALTHALKNEIPRTEVYDVVLAQLKSPDELSRFIKTHPDIISDLKPGLQESIERLMLEGRAEVQAAAVAVVTPGTKAIFGGGRNRLQALATPTEKEMAVLLGTKKAGQEVSMASSSGQEVLPQFLDRSLLSGVAFTESLIAEANKEVILYAAFPKFKISEDLLRSHPQEWIALLIEHGEFTLAGSTITERGTQYVLRSAQAGGVEMTIFSTSCADARMTSIDLCYLFKEKGVESLVPYRHHFVYLDDTIGSHAIIRDGESILESIFH